MSSAGPLFSLSLLLALGRETVVGKLQFSINTTCDGQAVSHDPVKLSLELSADQGLLVKIQAPFFNSPPQPAGPPGQPFPGLWDYEVVEAFFLNDKDQYLEVELCPYGQHLLLMLNGQRKMVKDQLPLTTFHATISGNTWSGQAVLPRSYLPPGVTKFNAYAIHGQGNNRVYESLYPATNLDQPDFHRLEFFRAINISEVLDNYDPNLVSDLWRPYQTVVG